MCVCVCVYDCKYVCICWYQRAFVVKKLVLEAF